VTKQIIPAVLWLSHSSQVLYIVGSIFGQVKLGTEKLTFNNRIFKTDFKFEEYFNILDEQNYIIVTFNDGMFVLSLMKNLYMIKMQAATYVL
jgi:hypothetical protein